ncbi:MAG: GH1 family beta-glucosidase, partial [Desulfobacterales bacterium]|nr:GH1 family beta-glucosidase [Desulfobacterales bacterium]
PNNFIWGAATASYQIEGAYNEDGKGESIWDRFAHQPNKILNNDTGDVACDHYHLMEQDVKLMQELGLGSYRFSISWPRILPLGQGQINQHGLDFYKRLINKLLENEITPMVTLYHWDLPQKLQEAGGWANRDTVKYFGQYADILFKEFGDVIPKWITINEPWVIAFAGHRFGELAPGIKNQQIALVVAHHLLLAHGMTVQNFHESNLYGDIGIALNLTPSHPYSNSAADQETANLQDDFINNWFLDPIFKGRYPEKLLAIYQNRVGNFAVNEGDLAIINQDIDFLGVNYYLRRVVKHNPNIDLLECEEIKIDGSEYTEMGWEVYPKGLYELLLWLKQEYAPKALYITENGAAYQDKIVLNQVHDPNRIEYLNNHFISAHKAIEKGVPLKGYYIWSLMDNFEWAHGYSKRFGLIYVDYANQKRIFKDSAYWYREIIRKN